MPRCDVGDRQHARRSRVALRRPSDEARPAQERRSAAMRDRAPATPPVPNDRRPRGQLAQAHRHACGQDRKSTRLNSSHGYISYAVFCLKKKKTTLTELTKDRKKKVHNCKY